MTKVWSNGQVGPFSDLSDQKRKTQFWTYRWYRLGEGLEGQECCELIYRGVDVWHCDNSDSVGFSLGIDEVVKHIPSNNTDHPCFN